MTTQNYLNDLDKEIEEIENKLAGLQEEYDDARQCKYGAYSDVVEEAEKLEQEISELQFDLAALADERLDVFNAIE